MKLYNKSRCPDGILRPLITAAGQRVGARTAGVVVKVTQGRSGRMRGMAYRGWPFLWHLTRHRQRGRNRTRMVRTVGGWIEITLPIARGLADSLKLAENVYRLLLHEWQHVREYQMPVRLRCDPNTVPHDSRIQERRAYAAERRGLAKGYSHKAEEAILALAVWFEENR